MPDVDEPTTDASKKDKKKDDKKAHRDPTREVVETIVFVVVLVLLLKLFVTEAFVIPTGSMAETLYGYQKIITCPKCQHEFPVNNHDEVEGRNGVKTPLFGFCCPNCRYLGQISELDPPPRQNSGDRVLVLKPLYNLRAPKRGDVVVFKYPREPQKEHTAQNYIKRAEGFGGETTAIHRGDLFVTRSLVYPPDLLDDRHEPYYPQPTDPLDLWKPRYTYSNAHPSEGNPLALKLFDDSRAAGFPPGPSGFGSGGFEIVRKGEDQLLADMRIVWDNNKQPKELAGKVPTRWYAPPEGKASWKGDDEDQPRVFGHNGDELHWIRYRHVAMAWKTKEEDPQGELVKIGPMEIVVHDIPATSFSAVKAQQPVPIDNFLGYNAGRDLTPMGARDARGREVYQAVERPQGGKDKLWVGDLMLECDATLGGGAEVTLELSKGVNRFRATFTEGKVTLSRLGRGNEKFGNPSRACKVAAGRESKLRFANVDCRLWVWVDGKRIDFGPEGDYLPVEPNADDKAAPEGWVQANDVDAPASIGAKGQVTVWNILLQRDIYYTRSIPDHASAEAHASADVFYVHPGHYLCLGDNSAQSSDSREWGVVPERLMLGKAVFVFFPIAPKKWTPFPSWKGARLGFIK